MLHVSGYGRGGPSSDRPGYGTLAEAMSGFAQVTGEPDGPPTLPPFMLADGVAAPGRHLGGDDGPLPPRRHTAAAGSSSTSTSSSRWPASSSRRPSPSTSSGSSPAGWATGCRPAPPATPTAPPTTSGWPSRARRPPSPCASSAPSAAPTWPRTPTTSTRCAARRTATRSTSWSPTGSAQRTLDEAMKLFLDAEVAAAPVYDAEQLLADEHLRGPGHLPAGRRSRPRAGAGAGPRWRC